MSIEHREVRKQKYTCGDCFELSSDWHKFKESLEPNVHLNKLHDVEFKMDDKGFYYEGINQDGFTVKIGYFDEG